ncbi:YrhC family protein [Peribacillus alkalitolerans]|uniref:YrhC family protein n=1 Tax=Peribacillus alkalitolerans TaxID=1550385 RepID=UPI0013D6708F|nr:YrhC family protein [Peribacillus alkalitolerans]
MEKQNKVCQNKMVDNKRFAITLLAVGVFFYLGAVIPSEGKSEFDTYVMFGSSVGFLGGSIFYFFRSKAFKNKLNNK